MNLINLYSQQADLEVPNYNICARIRLKHLFNTHFILGEFIVLRIKTFLLFIILLAFGTLSLVSAQDDKSVAAKEVKKQPEAVVKLSEEETRGIQVAESAIFVYSQLSGRGGLDQVRKTTLEVGDIITKNPDGTTVTADYEQRIVRGDSQEKEKIRLDQKFPTAQYAMVYDGEKVFGLYNNVSFSPRDDAAKSFQNQIWHSIEALLRYKENGSTVLFEKEDKIMNVDFYIVNLTDKENRKTKYFVSKKSLQVKMLEYQEEGINYRRKFYDHKLAQRTLVPFRSILWANDKQIEERQIATITFGQPVAENLFEPKK